MNTREKLARRQKAVNNPLCIGLDTEPERIPACLQAQGIQDAELMATFNLAIIQATHDYCSAYKINTAFYEQYGSEGFRALEQTLAAIPSDIVVILDAKRGDIGNTSRAYSRAAFEHFGADAVTVAPYMGWDSLEPFLAYRERMVFILALTSNKSSADFQQLDIGGKPLYHHVVETARSWASAEQVGFVVGATHPLELQKLRAIAPDNVFLIPGIGAQGGDVQTTVKANQGKPAIFTVSRAIVYASGTENFADAARAAAQQYSFSLQDFLSFTG